MSDLNFPTLEQVIARSETDAQTLIPESNPYQPESFFRAIIVTLAARSYENQEQIQSLLYLLFLPTTSGTFLDSWGSVANVIRKSSNPSSGNVTTLGGIGTLIPKDSVLSSSIGLNYKTLGNVNIQSVVIPVSLSRVGSTVTAVTNSTHPYASGLSITISETSDSDYSGDFVITVIDSLTFTYTITGNPPLTDTGISRADLASIPIESEDFSNNTNLSSGALLTFQNAIAGLSDGTARVQIDGIQGGQDNEDDTAYRERVNNYWKNPPASFSVSQISQLVLSIDGVTRVWVLPITPALGFTTVYFVRDNDTNIIPTQSEVENVKNQLLSILPASMDANNLIVSAPTPILVTFNFTSISPDISTLKNAVKANLIQFFKDQSEQGKNILKVAYDSAIYNTVDPVTGEQVTDFLLANPTSDIGISEGEIGVLNDVTF